MKLVVEVFFLNKKKYLVKEINGKLLEIVTQIDGSFEPVVATAAAAVLLEHRPGSPSRRTERVAPPVAPALLRALRQGPRALLDRRRGPVVDMRRVREARG